MSYEIDDPIIRRRRELKTRARRRNLILIAAASVCIVAVGAVVIASGLSAKGGFGPGRKSEGESWNHAELLAHLNRSGLKLSSVPTNRGTIHGPAAYFCGPDAMDKSAGLEEYVSSIFSMGQEDVVYVQIHENAQKAKDAVGTYGDRAWSWGRFAFVTTSNGRPLLQKIRSALE